MECVLHGGNSPCNLAVTQPNTVAVSRPQAFICLYAHPQEPDRVKATPCYPLPSAGCNAFFVPPRACAPRAGCRDDARRLLVAAVSEPRQVSQRPLSPLLGGQEGGREIYLQHTLFRSRAGFFQPGFLSWAEVYCPSTIFLDAYL